MALDQRQQFKLGFLLPCADAGLDVDQINQLIDHVLEKRAWGWEGLYDRALGLAKGSLFTAGGLALGAGAGTGYLAAKMTEPELDPEQIQKQELIAAYKQHTDRARRALANKSYRPSVRPSHF